MHIPRIFPRKFGPWLMMVLLWVVGGGMARASGTVREWGSQTGVIGAQSNVEAIAAGQDHTLGLLPGGFIAGWGGNNAGQLTWPFDVVNGGLLAVAAGDQRSYALKGDGSVSAWGNSVFLFGWNDITSIAARGNVLAGVTSGGKVLVNGGFNAPAELTGVTKVAVGQDHLLALKGDGTVVAWGSNDSGQATVPPGLDGVIAIAAGNAHSLALKSNGTVVAWGAAAGTFTDFGQADVPAGLTGVTAIAAGAWHSLALKSDGTTVGWGADASGQLTPPAGTGAVQAIAADGFRSVAIVTPTPDIRVFNLGNNRRVIDGIASDFGVVSLGGSLTRTFGISNYGSAPLTGLSLSEDGVNAARFTVSPLAVTTLAPGAYTTFTVTFSPDSLAAFFAALHLGSNDADDSMLDINLTGRTLLGAVTWPEQAPRPGSMPVGMAELNQVSSGGGFTAALDGYGQVVTWGGDSERGFYNATFQDLTHPVGCISMGDQEIGVLLKSDGSVWNFTQAGFSTQLLAAGSTVEQVAAGGNHFLAMKSDGSIIGWGDNTFGQLNIPGYFGCLAFTAGSKHSALVTAEGTVLAWGDNSSGQTDVPAGLRGIVDVVAGDRFTLALRGDGTVTGWGTSPNGQLTIPAGLNGVVKLAVSYSLAIALKSDGSVVVWGTGNTAMPTMLGRAGFISFNGSQPLALVTPVPEITVTENAVSILDGGSADYSWTTPGAPVTKTFTISNYGHVPLTGLSVAKSGANSGDFTLGTLGTTSVAPGASTNLTVTFSPAATGARLARLQIASNDPDENPYDIALVGRTPMSVVGWGWNASGQTDQPPGLGDVVALAAGYNHSLALRANGTVVAWGENNYGQCNVPAGLTGVKAIAAGWYHSLALRNDGTVVCWGNDGYQQLRQPAGLAGVKAIAAGAWHSLALKNDGSVAAWGLNVKGQADDSSLLANVMLVAGGYDHSLVMIHDEFGPYVIGIGSNADQQSGKQSLDPVAIAAGSYHNLALNRDGSVTGWGRALFPPTTLPAGLSGVAAIAAGSDYSAALKQDGTLTLWGVSSFGKSTVPANLGAIGGIATGANHMLALVAPMPDIAVTHTINRVGDGESVGFGITGTSGSDLRTFTILNRGTAPLTGLAVAKDGGDAANFIITSPLATALAPGVSTTFTVTFQTTTAGSKAAALHIASNDPDESPYDIHLSGATGLTPAEVWRQAWFGSTSNSGLGWDEADPDADGLANFVEFAFGTDPTNHSAVLAALAYAGPFSGGGTLIATGQPTLLIRNNGGTPDVQGLFIRRKDAAASNLTYTPQISADLTSWTALADTPAILAANTLHEVAAVTFPPLLGGKPPRFFRVILTLAP